MSTGTIIFVILMFAVCAYCALLLFGLIVYLWPIFNALFYLLVFVVGLPFFIYRDVKHYFKNRTTKSKSIKNKVTNNAVISVLLFIVPFIAN